MHKDSMKKDIKQKTMNFDTKREKNNEEKMHTALIAVQMNKKFYGLCR
jgi:hypothetical protein